jgi:uncharacterized protein YsxB (DUF464 family)
VISLRVRLHPGGLLAGFTASGHAGAGPKGEDIVCAAVTILLRTAAKVLAGEPGLTVEGQSPEPGVMRLALEPPPEAKRDWVRGVTATLLRGLTDLAEEFPGRLELRIDDLIEEGEH